MRIIFFADVTILRLDDLAEIRIVGDFLLHEILRRKNIRRSEDFFAAQFADAGFVEAGLVAPDFFDFALADFRLHEPAAFIHFGTINFAGNFQ